MSARTTPSSEGPDDRDEGRPAPPASDHGALPSPDHAWKLLSLINEWIRHADAKATVTLAFTGAIGTLLFNMVKDLATTSVWTDVTVVATCFFLVCAGVMCGLTLVPRTKAAEGDPAEEEINRLFFAHIAKHYNGDRVQYRDVLGTLTTDAVSLTHDLADQVHANARIATVKNKYAQKAITAVLAAGLSLALVAVTVAL